MLNIRFKQWPIWYRWPPIIPIVNNLSINYKFILIFLRVIIKRESKFSLFKYRLNSQSICLNEWLPVSQIFVKHKSLKRSKARQMLWSMANDKKLLDRSKDPSFSPSSWSPRWSRHHSFERGDTRHLYFVEQKLPQGLWAEKYSRRFTVASRFGLPCLT